MYSTILVAIDVGAADTADAPLLQRVCDRHLPGRT